MLYLKKTRIKILVNSFYLLFNLIYTHSLEPSDGFDQRTFQMNSIEFIASHDELTSRIFPPIEGGKF